MSVANILNSDPLGKQIDQPNLTVENLLTVKGNAQIDGTMNIGTIVADNITAYTNDPAYTGESAKVVFANPDFLLGEVVALDTSVPPNNTYYSKLQLKPQINDTTPEMFFVGRDANPDNSTRQLGAFARSRTQAGLFTAEARLGVTNVEPDALPAPITAGETYAFRLPQSGGSDALTLTAFDNTGAGSQKDVLNVLPSGARPYQTYQTTVAGNIVKLMSDATAGVIVAKSSAPDVYGTVYDSNLTTPVNYIPRAGRTDVFVDDRLIDATSSAGFSFECPATGMYMLTFSLISANARAGYTDSVNPSVAEIIDVVWQSSGTSIDTIVGSTSVNASEMPPKPIIGNEYYVKTFTTMAYCQQDVAYNIQAVLLNLASVGAVPIAVYNSRMMLTRMCGLGSYTIPA